MEPAHLSPFVHPGISGKKTWCFPSRQGHDTQARTWRGQVIIGQSIGAAAIVNSKTSAKAEVSKQAACVEAS